MHLVERIYMAVVKRSPTGIFKGRRIEVIGVRCRCQAEQTRAHAKRRRLVTIMAVRSEAANVVVHLLPSWWWRSDKVRRVRWMRRKVIEYESILDGVAYARGVVLHLHKVSVLINVGAQLGQHLLQHLVLTHECQIKYLVRRRIAVELAQLCCHNGHLLVYHNFVFRTELLVPFGRVHSLRIQLVCIRDFRQRRVGWI